MRIFELNEVQKKAFLEKYKENIDIEKPENFKIDLEVYFFDFKFLDTLYQWVQIRAHLYRFTGHSHVAIYPKEHVKRIGVVQKSIFVEIEYRYEKTLKRDDEDE